MLSACLAWLMRAHPLNFPPALRPAPRQSPFPPGTAGAVGHSLDVAFGFSQVVAITPAASNRRTRADELPAISRDPNVIGAGLKASCAHRSLSSSGFRHSRPIGTQPFLRHNSGDARRPASGRRPASATMAQLATSARMLDQISPPAGSASDQSGSLDNLICDGDALRIIFRNHLSAACSLAKTLRRSVRRPPCSCRRKSKLPSSRNPGRSWHASSGARVVTHRHFGPAPRHRGSSRPCLFALAGAQFPHVRVARHFPAGARSNAAFAQGGLQRLSLRFFQAGVHWNLRPLGGSGRRTSSVEKLRNGRDQLRRSERLCQKDAVGNA